MELISKHNIKVILKKIKGHSNNVYNDQADRLAKKGRDDSILHINPQALAGQKLICKWNDTIIEGSIRSHFKLVSKIYFKENWINSFACRSIVAIQDQCNWPLTWRNLTFVTSQAPTSIKHTTERTFKIKNLNMTLPTLEFLKLTQPHIYDDT